MTPDQKNRLHKAALAVSIANMKHEAAMKECIEIMNEICAGDMQGQMAHLASELEQCYHLAKANHSRLNRIGCGALEWDIPVALSR